MPKKKKKRPEIKVSNVESKMLIVGPPEIDQHERKSLQTEKLEQKALKFSVLSFYVTIVSTIISLFFAIISFSLASTANGLAETSIKQTQEIEKNNHEVDTLHKIVKTLLRHDTTLTSILSTTQDQLRVIIRGDKQLIFQNKIQLKSVVADLFNSFNGPKGIWGKYVSGSQMVNNADAYIKCREECKIVLDIMNDHSNNLFFLDNLKASKIWDDIKKRLLEITLYLYDGAPPEIEERQKHARSISLILQELIPDLDAILK